MKVKLVKSIPIITAFFYLFIYLIVLFLFL